MLVEQEPEKKQTKLVIWLMLIKSWPRSEVFCLFVLLLVNLVPLTIFIFRRDFWQLPAGLVLFDVVLVDGLYILHFPRRFWRENRWIMLPAVFVILVWVNGTWLQAHVTTRNAPVLQRWQSAETHAVHITFPQKILFETEKLPEMTLWQSCPCATCADTKVKLTAKEPGLLFSLDQEPNAWHSELALTLPSDGTAQVVRLLRANRNLDQIIPLSITLTYKNLRYNVGKILLEGEQSAKARLFLGAILQSSNIVITIIVAAFAGLKQLDEQKRSRRKNKIDELIKKIKDFKYEKGRLASLVTETLSELDDWETWESEQRDEFIKTYKELIVGHNMEGQWWQESLQAESIFIPAALEIAAAIFHGQYLPPLLIEIEQKMPTYRPARSSAYFPPEPYPLEACFRQLAGQSLPTQDASGGYSLWEMRFDPYGDATDPFRYWQDEKQGAPRQFPLQDVLELPLGAEKFQSQDYYFQNGWDLRSAFYRYCRSFLDFIRDETSFKASRQTFYVPVMPDDTPAWRAVTSPEVYLLHGLAGAWLRALAHNPYLSEQNTPLEQELLASLLLWRYPSAFAIKTRLLEQAARSALPLSPSPAFLQLLEKTKPADPDNLRRSVGLLALRPSEAEHTLFLCAECAPNGVCAPTFSTYLRALHIKPDLPAAYLARFLLKTRRDDAPALQVDHSSLRRFLDSRIRLSGSPRLTFEGLFYPPPTQEVIETFVAGAGGSPGILVQKAHELLRRHLEQAPDEPDILPEVLLE